MFTHIVFKLTYLNIDSLEPPESSSIRGNLYGRIEIVLPLKAHESPKALEIYVALAKCAKKCGWRHTLQSLT